MHKSTGTDNRIRAIRAIRLIVVGVHLMEQNVCDGSLGKLCIR